VVGAAVKTPAGPPTSAHAEIVEVSTPSSSLILDAKKGKKLRHVYYGGKISDKDTYDQLKSGVGAALDAYPAYGLTTTSETAVAATHADGNMTLDLVVDGIGKTQCDGADITTVKLRDTYYPFYVNVNYRTYPGDDVIETWTEISHAEKGEVAGVHGIGQRRKIR